MAAPAWPARNVAILGLVFSVALAVVLWRLNWLIGNGGGPFTQGDWLVNLQSGLVRRGGAGEVFLAVSDATGIGLLPLVGGVQAVLVVAIFAMIFHGALLARLPDRLLLILVSPLLVTFWAIDSVGAFRKELLGLLAFLPLLPQGRGRVAAWLVPVLFAVAVAAHEANAFFVPALCVGVMIRFGAEAPERRMRMVAVILAIGVLGFGFAIQFRSLPDTVAMCAALTARGLSPEICGGAIDWMDDPAGSARGPLRNLLDRYSQTAAGLVFAALLVPVALAYRHAPKTRLWLAAGAVVFAGFLPLYAVAVDWGRWMSMFMFSAAFLTMLLAIHTEAGWLRRPVPPMVFGAVLVMSGGLGVYHYGGLPMPGFVPVVADIAARKLVGGGLLP
uniref:hypothetical protein n=1 Tax=Roseovarius indicus TaxID=540747 RepID=UPI003B52BB29